MSSSMLYPLRNIYIYVAIFKKVEFILGQDPSSIKSFLEILSPLILLP